MPNATDPLALRARLRGTAPRTSAPALGWFSLSALTVFVPLLVLTLSRPHVRAALRALMERLRGG